MTYPGNVTLPTYDELILRDTLMFDLFCEMAELWVRHQPCMDLAAWERLRCESQNLLTILRETNLRQKAEREVVNLTGGRFSRSSRFPKPAGRGPQNKQENKDV